MLGALQMPLCPLQATTAGCSPINRAYAMLQLCVSAKIDTMTTSCLLLLARNGRAVCHLEGLPFVC